MFDILRVNSFALAIYFASTTYFIAATAVADQGEAPKQLTEARAAISEGDFDRATAEANRYLKQPNLSTKEIVEGLRIKGSAYLRNEQYDRAIASFGSALEFDPDDIWLLWQRCWASTEAGYLPTARRDCRRARVVLERKRIVRKANFTDELYVAFAEAKLARTVGQPREALETLNTLRARVESSDNQIADWYLEKQIGITLRDLGASDQAILAFDRAIEGAKKAGDKELASLAFERGSAQFSLGRFIDAASDVERATVLDPTNTEYAYALCSINLVAEQNDVALSACERLPKLEPTNTVFLDAHGLALMRNGEVKAAISRFDEALSHEPSNAVVQAHKKRALNLELVPSKTSTK